LGTTIRDFAAKTVRLARHLPVFYSNATEQPAAELRPVVAPGVRVDQWRLHEFAGGEDVEGLLFE